MTHYGVQVEAGSTGGLKLAHTEDRRQLAPLGEPTEVHRVHPSLLSVSESHYKPANEHDDCSAKNVRQGANEAAYPTENILQPLLGAVSRYHTPSENI